ncbi:MAG: 4Fe-4S dicluster domain-containing protein, partial [Phycisphaerales bacterium]
MTDNFWETFGPWWMAPPFLLICGFATVYFLGSKGFCTYGCPYGGFFAPLDKLSLGRIEVNDNCNQCGHCTAACDSNVRVHQEVKEFGRVVDPGCMKCFDCVNVCPNDALKFTFGLPSIFAKARPEAGPRAQRPEYDLSLWGELVVLAVGWVLFCGFRGMFDHIALLMAMGMAACSVFMLWKLWKVVTVQNVRLHGFQLRQRGKLRPAGAAFAFVAIAIGASGVWGAMRDANMLTGDYHDLKIIIPENVVLTPEYQPKPEHVRHADAGIAAYSRADSFSNGGFGWRLPPETPARMAWFHVVKKDLPGAERWMRRAMEYPEANEELAISMTLVMALQGKGPDEINGAAREIVDAHPRMYRMRFALAVKLLENGDAEGAATLARQVLEFKDTVPSQAYLECAGILASAGKTEDALGAVAAGRAAYPEFVPLYIAQAQLCFRMNRVEEAVAALRPALALAPRDAELHRSFANLLRAAASARGRQEWAEEAGNVEKRAAELESAVVPTAPGGG